MSFKTRVFILISPLCLLLARLAVFAWADVQYHYDNKGRLESVEYGDGTIVRYEYDDNGNRTARIPQQGAGTFPITVTSGTGGDFERNAAGKSRGPSLPDLPYLIRIGSAGSTSSVSSSTLTDFLIMSTLTTSLPFLASSRFKIPIQPVSGPRTTRTQSPSLR